MMKMQKAAVALYATAALAVAVPQTPAFAADAAEPEPANAAPSANAGAVATADQICLNVHLTGGVIAPETLAQMNPVLIAADGSQVKPTGVKANGFTLLFNNVPAGDYTLSYTVPEGYRFAPGSTRGFGPYTASGETVTVTAGHVVSNLYTRIEKAPAIAKFFYVDVQNMDVSDDELHDMSVKLMAADGTEFTPAAIIRREGAYPTLRFENIPLGDYTVSYTLPRGYSASTPTGSPLPASGGTVSVTRDFMQMYLSLTATAERSFLNVHLKKGFANPALLAQMNPVLIAADGSQVKPTGMKANGFTLLFNNVPAGNYTLSYTVPEGYRFAPGSTRSFGPYTASGETVTLKPGRVANSLYTRLEKVADQPASGPGDSEDAADMQGNGDDGQTKMMAPRTSKKALPATGDAALPAAAGTLAAGASTIAAAAALRRRSQDPRL
ncbi:hypothetical protein HLV37_00745 [Eggerthellaceae bacterium zg-1084]|uniref:MSCRAMM family protein n=1 Tax=Berryella wangjianweii TaxID=2734634 RepID=UPI0015540106|nr:hypothetical protein [Berryella wangjianweii]NPD30418.1 hypothetical protein [Berryella wangjianweii]